MFLQELNSRSLLRSQQQQLLGSTGGELTHTHWEAGKQMLWGGMKIRATGFTRNWCLTNLTFCSAFQGLLYSGVLPRFFCSSESRPAARQSTSWTSKMAKQDLFVDSSVLQPLTDHLLCCREKNPLGTRWPRGLWKEQPIKDPNTRKLVKLWTCFYLQFQELIWGIKSREAFFSQNFRTTSVQPVNPSTPLLAGKELFTVRRWLRLVLPTFSESTDSYFRHTWKNFCSECFTASQDYIQEYTQLPFALLLHLSIFITRELLIKRAKFG